MESLQPGSDTLDARQLLHVLTALRDGDFRARMPAGGEGLGAEIAGVLNQVMDRQAAFAAELERVTREVGYHGRLGGQVDLEGATGGWKEMAGGVNLMLGNLTGQLRDLAQVLAAVARGDLSRAVAVD